MSAEKSNPRSKNYLLLFFAYNGPGPHKCVYCGEEVLAPWLDDQTSRKWRFAIHHANGDHDDNRIENLQPIHCTCHSRLHKLEGKISPEHVRALRKGLAKWWEVRDVKQRKAHAEKIGAASAAARKLMTPEERKKSYGRTNSRSASHRESIANGVKSWWAQEGTKERLGEIHKRSWRNQWTSSREKAELEEKTDNGAKGYGLHVRWHVNRDLVNPECRFCTPDREI